MPISFNACFASPVPCAASPTLRVNLCKPMSRVRCSTPANLAAYLKRCNSSDVTPSFDETLPSLSVASSDLLIKKPSPVMPAAETKPVFKLKTALRVLFKPRPIALKAFLV